MDLTYGINGEPVIIITTYDTFSTKQFINMIKGTTASILLIADEVHSAGSDERRFGLIENYKLQAGISATPTRYFDEEGSQVINNYFGDVVFELNLQKAIQDGFLCEYEYYPYFVSLTKNELVRYKKLTQKIARNLGGAKKSSENNNKLLQIFMFERSRIIANAQEKITKFRDIVKSEGSLSYCLVYCMKDK